MRITHVITRLIIGGAQENTVASVLGLRQKPGLSVRLLSGPTAGPEGSLEPCFADAPEILTIVPHLIRPIRPWKDYLACARLTKLWRHHPPDLVHTHSGKAGILGRLAARRAGVPIIVHTIHGPSFGAFQGGSANQLFRAAERYVGRWTTHFVSVADAMTEQYLAAGIGRRAQFTRIYSGFALEPFLSAKPDPVFRASLGLGPQDFVVGMIARLTALKGHDDLIAAAPTLAKSCPQAKFLLVGDGPWRERLEQKVRVLALSNRFVFASLVPPKDIARYVGAMDILVHLSRREGLARALSQALAGARPVVAYDCDGAKEVCVQGETGFLIPPGDLDSFRERVLQLAREPDLRERLGQQGRWLVKERFPVQRMIDELHSLYQKLANQLGTRFTTV